MERKFDKKTVRLAQTDEHGQFITEIFDERVGRSHISGYIINEEYFVASADCPLFDPRDGTPLMRRMERESAEWQKAANNLARNFCPPIYACSHCGGPVITGYCCNRCGSSEP